MKSYPEWRNKHCRRWQCKAAVPLGAAYCSPCVREINRQQGKVKALFTERWG